LFTGTVTNTPIPLLVYELPGARRRVYFADSVSYIPPDEAQAFKALIALPPGSTASIIECAEPECANAPNTAHQGDAVTITKIQSGYMEARTKNTESRWLVFSESDMPTWEVRIDGVL